MPFLAQKLTESFKGWHADPEGSIEALKLRDVLKAIAPDFTDRELDRLVASADHNSDGVIGYEEFNAFVISDTLASAAGTTLPTGSDSDSKVGRLQECLVNIREPRFNLKSSLEELRDILDPCLNPAGYRLCQDQLIAADVVDVLLQHARNGFMEADKKDKNSDLIRSLALEILARLAFGHQEGARTVAASPEFVASLRHALGSIFAPQKLAALQLLQAVSAAHGSDIDTVMLELLPIVVPLLSTAAFRPLMEAAFDIIVTCSFHRASMVVDAVGWSELAKMVDEGEERPSWLPAEPLQIFLCGRLAANILSEIVPEKPEDLQARDCMAQHLASGRFLEYCVEAFQAAVAKREWPVGTQAYHSVTNLAELVKKLAGLGHSRALVGVIQPLTKAVELLIDDVTTTTALRALQVLSVDLMCFNELSTMDTWRRETLDWMHKSGDVPIATELLSYLETVELAFIDAQAAFDLSKGHMQHAPSVQQLAEVFASLAPLDKVLSSEQLLMAAEQIPLGPKRAVTTSWAKATLDFRSFATQVYGTPTFLGLWPSLMEDVAASLAKIEETLPHMPNLANAVRLFEVASEGKRSLGAEAIYERVLPSIGVAQDAPSVEAEIGYLGAQQLEFKEFVNWLLRLCTLLRDEQEQNAAAP